MNVTIKINRTVAKVEIVIGVSPMEKSLTFKARARVEMIPGSPDSGSAGSKVTKEILACSASQALFFGRFGDRNLLASSYAAIASMGKRQGLRFGVNGEICTPRLEEFPAPDRLCIEPLE